MFVGTALHLIEPRTFFAGAGAPRRMVYGRNLTTLEFSRTLGGKRVPTIEIRSFDGQLGRTRWARYPVAKGAPASGIFGRSDPPKPTRANRPGVSGGTPSEKIETYTVSGVADGAQLARIARATYEQISRQEIEGNWATSDVQSVGRDDADLLNLRSGDAVELLVAASRSQDDAASEAQNLQAMGVERRAGYLRRLGWAPDVASKLAALQQATAFQTVFRVRNAKIEYSYEEGVKVSCDFINFISIARDNPGELEDPDAEASPEVQNLAGARDDGVADDARQASRERRQLAKKLEDGTIDLEEFNRETERLVNEESLSAEDLRSR
jgi:hypothetical protein